MLIAIRERAKGWLAWLLVGAVVLALTATGIFSYFSGPPPSEVAEVAGNPISRDAVERAYQQQRRELEQRFGGQLDPRLFDDRQMRRAALQALIDQELLRQYVREQGYQLSDAALAQFIRSQPYFQVNGQFSPEQYRALLRSEGFTPESYEARLRVEQVLAQAQQGIYESAFATSPEVQRLLDLQRQERELTFLVVPVDAFKSEVQVSAEDVRAYYDDNSSLFQQPERVKLAYLELSPATLAGQAQISEDEVRSRYEEVKQSRFTEGGQRQIRHILLTLPEGADAQQVEQTRERLADLRRQILAGEASFAEVAKEYSQDPGAAQNGGDLGWVSRGEMVPEFERAAFSLNKNELSEPVRSDYGWHLIEVTDIKPEQVKPFAEVKDELRREMVEERVGREIAGRANRLANLAYEHPDQLETAATDLGLQVQQTDWIDRNGGSGIAANPEVVKAAFSDDVLVSQRNSQLLELGPNHYAIVRVAEHQPAEVRPFEEVQAEARTQLVQQRAAAMVQELGAELSKKAEAGEPLPQLAQNKKVRLEQPGFVGRSAENVPMSVLQKAFQLPKPAEGATSIGNVRLSDGGYAVVAVSGVRESAAAESGEDAERLATELKAFHGEQSLQGLMALLRQRGDVKIYEDRL
ncbi:MAG TPA: SurA N-terminal domain-containing protein [Gammaproteobacteria bacterium]|nr:SurA N-terminal domain-containing protein [Gammaproteobacteria bacterium]